MIKKNMYFYLILFFMLFTFIPNVYALEDNLKSNNVKLQMCSLSKEYLEWEKLSNEEKSKTLMPVVCDYEENVSNKNISLMTLFNLKYSNLPVYYDGRSQEFAASVKNQDATGECWSFSTTSALEYNIGKEYGLDYVFSVRHIEYTSTRDFLNNEINEYGYNRLPGDGGNYFMSANYLANNMGPILEEEMPFSLNEEIIDISEIQNKNIVLDVNNIVLEPGNDYGVMCTLEQIGTIKEYVYNNGAVGITTYMTLSPNYYNSKTAAFYYNGEERTNHAVLIVGWDDNYSKDNFSSVNKPTSDGAWIVQNSYGESFGDKGYYYISYEDVHVCNIYLAFDNIDDKVEDNKYIYDKLGYATFFGFQDETSRYNNAYAMNVFTKSKEKIEILKEVTFGSSGKGTYSLYYTKGNGKDKVVSEMLLIGKGNLEHSGYITHKLENPIYMGSDVEEFSIVVYYDMETSISPLPISTSSIDSYKYITLDNDRSFVSYDGNSWDDLKTMSSDTLIASLKGFTDNADYSFSFDNINVSLTNLGYSVDIKYTSNNINTDNLKFILKDNLGNEVYANSILFDGEKISLILDKNIKCTDYSISVYYNDTYIDTKAYTITGEVMSDVYTIDYDKKVIFVQPNTSLDDFVSNVKGITMLITSTNKQVYTGLKIDGYSVVVLGDVNGDGFAKMNDVMQISSYIVEGTGINDYYYQLAADVTLDNVIKMNDVMKISNYIVEGGKL